MFTTAAMGAANFGLMVHGGTSSRPQGSMSPELEAQYKAAMDKALRAGHEVLESGGEALEAVMVAIEILEDEPLYNAGRGAAITREGTVELDASIMDGRNRNAGAVTLVTTVRHPIRLAYAVMESTPYVMLGGHGAENLADQIGLARVDNKWFVTPERWARYERARKAESKGATVEFGTAREMEDESFDPNQPDLKLWGTVGAVALDRHGNLAAGTSTGGVQDKHPGRIGDAPIIGAATWAENATVAVSTTGMGEFFIRTNVAADVSARMMYAGNSVQEAARAVIHDRLAGIEGRGALIAIDKDGNIAAEFNSVGLYRGSINAAGQVNVAIY